MSCTRHKARVARQCHCIAFRWRGMGHRVVNSRWVATNGCPFARLRPFAGVLRPSGTMVGVIQRPGISRAGNRRFSTNPVRFRCQSRPAQSDLSLHADNGRFPTPAWQLAQPRHLRVTTPRHQRASRAKKRAKSIEKGAFFRCGVDRVNAPRFPHKGTPLFVRYPFPTVCGIVFTRPSSCPLFVGIRLTAWPSL